MPFNSSSHFLGPRLVFLHGYQSSDSSSSNPNKTELLFVHLRCIPMSESCDLSGKLLDRTLIMQVLDNHLSITHTANLLAVSIYRGHYGARLVRCLREPGLLQLTPFRPASTGHPTLKAGPECSCRTCFQCSQVLPHHPSAVFPALASCRCSL